MATESDQPNDDAIPALLKRYRLVNGVSQQGLAERLRVAQSTISRWEKGLVEADPAARRRIRDLLAHSHSDDSQVLHVFNHLPVAATILDKDCHFIAVSVAAAHAHNLEPNDLIGRSFRKLLNEDVADLLQRLDENGFFRGEVASVEASVASLLTPGHFLRCLWHPIQLSDGRTLAGTYMRRIMEAEYRNDRLTGQHMIITRFDGLPDYRVSNKSLP